jgi:peptide/nickel transport system substrate-binding protein
VSLVFAGGGGQKPAPAPAAGGTAAPAPAPAPAQGAQKGASLIGKLEGPEIIRDVAKFPSTFKDAPSLQGKGLPAVAQRLPERSDLLVIKPLKEIGKYGGNWRRAFTGPADTENGSRIVNSDQILAFDYTGTKIMPSLAKDWKVSADGKTTTIYLRKGLKWSDGTPCTADDFMFWYNDIYMNKAIVPTPFFEFQVNGKPGVMKKIDDYTVAFEFPEPYSFFVYQLAGSTAVGAGFSTRGAFQNWGGCVAPAHYLKQFLPKYSTEADVTAKAKAAGFDGWVSWLRMKYSFALNPDLPVLTPWKTVSPINTPTWALERNPFFWGVDTEGNQLPYIDRITMTLAENAEVANLRAIAGEFDIQERHMHLAKLPIFLENQQKGNYTVRLDPSFNGTDAAIHIGTSFVGDPEIMKWLRTRDFRRALALGVNRDQLNEAIWLGVGTAGSVAPAPSTIYSPGPEYNKKWATHDVAQANKLLDGLGLTKKDAEGFRERSDGKGRLRLEMITVGGQFVEYTKIGEMVKQQWRAIGIDVDVKELERNLAFTRDRNNENQLITWANDGSEMLLLFPRHAIPVDAAESHMGHAYARWYASNGADGTKPVEAEMERAFDFLRKAYASDEAGQISNAKEVWKIITEEVWSIGTVGQSPAFMGVRLVKNNMGNIPERQANAQHTRTPWTSQPSTFFFK